MEPGVHGKVHAPGQHAADRSDPEAAAEHPEENRKAERTEKGRQQLNKNCHYVLPPSVQVVQDGQREVQAGLVFVIVAIFVNGALYIF